MFSLYLKKISFRSIFLLSAIQIRIQIHMEADPIKKTLLQHLQPGELPGEPPVLSVHVGQPLHQQLLVLNHWYTLAIDL